MEQSSFWNPNGFSTSQEIPLILRNPKVPYCIYNCPPPVRILSQINSVRTLTFHFLKIHFIIILGPPSGLFPSGLPTKTMYAPLLFPYVLHAPSISFSILSSEQYSVSSTDHQAPNYIVFSTPLLPFLLGPNILLSTLFSNTLSQCSSFNVSDQVSHPYKTKGKKI